MFNEIRAGTPVESHRCGYKTVRVKRDDLAGIYPAPPLGKLRGIVRQVLDNWKQETVIGVVDRSPASRNSWAFAYVANRLGARCVAYGTAKGGYQEQAERLGAEYRLVPDGSPEEVYAAGAADFHRSEPGGYMPTDDCHSPEIVEDMRRETIMTGLAMACDTLVIPTGSGGTALGILWGVDQLGSRLRRIVLHITGSRRTPEYLVGVLTRGGISDKLMRSVGFIADGGERAGSAPFPANPKYEEPAWNWLAAQPVEETGEVLFWNAGGG